MTEKMPAIPDSGPRGSWLAELKECDKYRNSLTRQMKRAARAGDRRKLADLDKRYWAMALWARLRDVRVYWTSETFNVTAADAFPAERS